MPTPVPEELSYEEMLRELARELPTNRRLNLRQYFEILEWATLFTPLPADGLPGPLIRYENQGVQYVLFFTRSEEAVRILGTDGCLAKRVPVRPILERVQSDCGVIIDAGTNVEVRISPDQLTQMSEGIRIKPVRQEATNPWLAETNSRLSSEGVPLADRATRTKALWATLNGRRVLPESRRDRRIDWYFAVVADATAAESADRCDALWRSQYAADPYLRHLSNDDLEKRLFAIRNNLLFVDRQSLPHELDEREWRELYEHVRFEHEDRALRFREAIPIAERLAAWPRFELARAVFSRYDGPKGQLFKFGKLEHIEPMLREGKVRVFPAARYDDPSLTPAQRDEELKRTVLIDSKDVRIEHTGGDGVRRPIQAVGTFRMTSIALNCHVWCTTTTFDPRLFDDFNADTCLIIHDAQVFIERMFAAMERERPERTGAPMLVHYFDPVKPGNEVLSAGHKDFMYSYQREYRFLWDPPQDMPPDNSLGHVDICLGSLADIASIVKL